MTALIIVDIEVTDLARYEDYKKLASASIAAHGGRYLARGGVRRCSTGIGRRGVWSCSSSIRSSSQEVTRVSGVCRGQEGSGKLCTIEHDRG